MTSSVGVPLGYFGYKGELFTPPCGPLLPSLPYVAIDGGENVSEWVKVCSI